MSFEPRSSFCLASALLGALVATSCGASEPTTTPITFWQDVAPIYNDKCVRCHQEGGIAPFALDNFSDAKTHAAAAKVATQAGTMPPYFQVHDGSCGDFHDEATLSGTQKNVIARWLDDGLREGTAVTLTRPLPDRLPDSTMVETPTFAPVAQGTAIAAHDEYRCFAVDPPTGGTGYLTAYEVRPGNAAIVHHVLGFIVDPKKKGDGGIANGDIMKKLHADAVAREGKERDGWPCFGGAGEGVNPESVPVTWAPGQGVVRYPTGMGAPLAPGQKLVFQMHYNMEDPTTAGLTDHTTVVFHVEPSVTRALVFLLNDPFLDSLQKPTPDTLPPGDAHAQYKWSATFREMGLDGPGLDLVGVMPHMHARGRKQSVHMGPSTAPACISNIENWNFHWQEMYFYKTPLRVQPTDRLDVTCEYDTSADATPVLPGWGTGNEMCVPIMVIALPST